MTEIQSSSLLADSPAALLDVRQVAALLNCSPRTCYRFADGGLMPQPHKLGALVRWSKAEIDAWIAAGCPRVRTATKGGAK
jgi:excisionase family DNA binding protein